MGSAFSDPTKLREWATHCRMQAGLAFDFRERARLLRTEEALLKLAEMNDAMSGDVIVEFNFGETGNISEAHV